MNIIKLAMILGIGYVGIKALGKKAATAPAATNSTDLGNSVSVQPETPVAAQALNPNLIVHGINSINHPGEVLVWNKITGISTWMPGDPAQIEAASNANPSAGIWYDQPYVPPGSGLPIRTSMALGTYYGTPPPGAVLPVVDRWI